MKNILIFILECVLICSLHAQGTGTLTGIVSDSAIGEVLVGVNIYVQNTPYGASTDSIGKYEIRSMLPGKYTVLVSYVGYGKLEARDILIEPDSVTVIDVKLTAQAIQGEMVTIKICMVEQMSTYDWRSLIIPETDTDLEYNDTREKFKDGDFIDVSRSPSSTLFIDVDTTSYCDIRQSIDNELLPQSDKIQTEECINYFPYNYPEPSDKHPFSVTTELAPAPWNPDHQLLMIGLKGKNIAAEKSGDNYSYINNSPESKKGYTGKYAGKINIIAGDVKFQVQFNPVKVRSYRLIGYENRLLYQDCYHWHKKDSSNMGAGQSVTVFYEIDTVGAKKVLSKLDSILSKIPGVKRIPEVPTNELLTIKLQYKRPEDSVRVVQEVPVAAEVKRFRKTSKDFRFATSVIQFCMILKGSKFLENMNYDDVLKLARAAKGKDKEGCRSEFIHLVETCKLLSKKTPDK